MPESHEYLEKAPYAVWPSQSKGRYYPEERQDFRSPFQRDRDRVVHSTAFRRLAHKTQVFVSHEGDLFRTRLTHSLEVAQVSRALARRLRLDEDMAETVALAHDLGHPPFGHTGEEALQAMMEAYGGFDHNAQALRLVTTLEERYASFPGLNLTWETLEGMAKHNGPVTGALPWALDAVNARWDLELGKHTSLEAQIAAIADDIAYNHHDIQDGLRSGLIDEAQLLDIELLRPFFLEVEQKYPQAPRKIRHYEALSRFFTAMVNDVYDETVKNLQFAPQSVDDIRQHNAQIVRFSSSFFQALKALRAFLFERLYRHPDIVKMRETADAILRKSFAYAFEHPEVLPQDWRESIDITDDKSRARLVSDYISGMTDGYISVEWHFAHGLKWPETIPLFKA